MEAQIVFGAFDAAMPEEIADRLEWRVLPKGDASPTHDGCSAARRAWAPARPPGSPTRRTRPPRSPP
jgi:hypothetical protein